jgi:predicted amidophosphoribosyltransferase
MEKSYCRNCGNRLTLEDVGSCPNCGSPIRSTPTLAPDAEVPPDVEDPPDVEVPPVPETTGLGIRTRRVRRR